MKNKTIVVSVIIALISIYLTLYTTFFYGGKQALLEIEYYFKDDIVNESPGTVILETKSRDEKKPSIVLNSKDWKKESNKKILSSAYFRFTNDGTKNIEKNDIEQEILWGLKFYGVKLIDVSLFSTNAVKIEKYLKTTILDDNFIKINPILIEKRNSFTIRVVFEYKKGTDVGFSSEGVITGLDVKIRRNKDIFTSYSYPLTSEQYYLIFGGFIVIALSVTIVSFNIKRKKTNLTI